MEKLKKAQKRFIQSEAIFETLMVGEIQDDDEKYFECLILQDVTETLCKAYFQSEEPFISVKQKKRMNCLEVQLLFKQFWKLVQVQIKHLKITF